MADKKINVYFEDLDKHVLTQLKKAKKTVNIAVAWLSFDVYEKTFEKLLKKGVKLKIITSNSRQEKYSPIISSLVSKGAEIKKIQMPKVINHMHHKFCIIDEETILCGSFNWTENAKRNFEDLIIIKNNPKIIKKFEEEFIYLTKTSIDTLKQLQSSVKCKHKECEGFVYNLLVFEDLFDEYGTYRCNVVQVCSEDYYEHSKILNSDIESSNLYYSVQSIIDEYNEEVVEYEVGQEILEDIEEKYAEKMKELLNNFEKYNEFFIHIVAFVGEETVGQDGETIPVTIVKWKNRFISSYVPDKYESNMMLD